MTLQSNTPRDEPASAPAYPAPPTTASGGTLRRVAPPAPAVAAPTPVKLSPRIVTVIAQIPNFTLARTPARISAELAVTSSAPRTFPSLPRTSAPDAPVPASRVEAAILSPPVKTRTSAAPPVAAAAPQPVAPLPVQVSAPRPSADPKATLAQRLRWLENLPEWQRLGLQAIVMIAAAILVVGTFAWWRNPGSQADPLPRRPAKLLEGAGELLRADASRSTSAASIARKTTPRSRPSDNASVPDETPRTAAPPMSEPVEESAPVPSAPPTMPPPTGAVPPTTIQPPTTMQSPDGSMPPPANLTPSANNAPVQPSLNSPNRAAHPAYPTTDPQRFQFRVPQYAEGGGPPASNPPRGGDDQPSAETARLGEIAPLGPGNIR